jgi:hypothetical protein
MILLTGQYEDASARDYVLMQDSVEPTEDASIAHVRVMRQGDPRVLTGLVRIPADVWHAAGKTDDERNSALCRAVVWWLSDHPSVRTFAVQAALSAGGSVHGVEVHAEASAS